jgi:hypothetical protein
MQVFWSGGPSPAPTVKVALAGPWLRTNLSEFVSKSERRKAMADDVKWYDEIIVTARFWSRELTVALPTTTSLLLRLGLLYLFFWYLFDFAFDLGYPYLRFAILVLIAGSLVFTLLIWKLVNSCKNIKSSNDAEPDSILPFVSINIIPIAAVAVATWYGYCFDWGLLQFTQHTLRRLARIF